MKIKMTQVAFSLESFLSETIVRNGLVFLGFHYFSDMFCSFFQGLCFSNQAYTLMVT